MPYSDEKYDLRIQLETKGYRLTPGEDEKMHEALTPLVRAARDFPLSDLYITIIHHARSNDFHVKTSLALSGARLFTGDRDPLMYPAFERCVRKLIRKVKAYKQSMSNAEELTKIAEGTHHRITPGTVPEPAALAEAFEQGDYGAFRMEAYGYEDGLRKRIGRWIERYPQVSDHVGETIEIEDLVEEVFLNAFERFGEHPRTIPFGDWLESLIDPSIKGLLRHPDEELENIEFVRSAFEVEATARRSS